VADRFQSRAAEYLSQKLGRPPSEGEFATDLRMSVEDVVEASLAYCTLSPDLPPTRRTPDPLGALSRRRSA
jgi:hypothetical protein